MYWEYEGKKYYNLLSAHKDAKGEQINFCLPKSYDEYCWTIEPKESWEECMLRHAFNLRKKYRYLRIWYTGGVDSQTVLNTFIKNNIHIDEIAIVRSYPAKDDPETLNNSEVTNVATPFIHHIKEKIPMTNVVYYDLTKEHWLDFYLDNKSGYITKNHAFPFFAAVCIPYWAAKNRDNKDVGNIIGSEKPKVSLDERGYYFCIIDKTISQHLDDPEFFNIEHFFLHPEVYAKQAHMLKNHIKNKNNSSGLLDMHKYWNYVDEVNSVCRDPLYIDFSLHKCISLSTSPYFSKLNINEDTTWEILKKYGLEKEKYNGIIPDLSSKCHFLIHDAHKYDPELISIYLDRLEYISKIYQNEINAPNYLTNGKDTYGGRIGNLSKKYYLEYL